jgi:DNA-binding response OmpR family regulator
MEGERPRMTKILVVDDERNLVDLIVGYLQAEGYAVSSAFDGPTALQIARAERPDLVVLDVMLPEIDGIEVCRRLRQFSDAYVLMLTARGEEIDKIVGLSVGADDYVTKPFSPRELVARVKAMLRRPRTQSADVDEQPPLHMNGLVIDAARHEVTRDGEVLALTAREFALLETLAAHPGRVFTREQLLERVWGDEYYDDHVVDVHVGNLRKKLEEDPAAPRYVETVRGVGYRFAGRTKE